MPTYPQPAPPPTALAAVPAATFSLAEVKARAKAIRKAHKHETRRVFFGWCACLHALGFSF